MSKTNSHYIVTIGDADGLVCGIHQTRGAAERAIAKVYAVRFFGPFVIEKGDKSSAMRAKWA